MREYYRGKVLSQLSISKSRFSQQALFTAASESSNSLTKKATLKTRTQEMETRGCLRKFSCYAFENS